jgi:ATP-dependent exoDNAse (exonuclease V) alpha subunit
MTNEIKEKKFKVEKVVYYNSQKLWGVIGITPIDDLGDLKAELLNVYGSISACGSFPKPYEDAEVIISGDVIVNPQYGKQISIKELKIKADTSSKEGIINYLAKGEIEGIGVQLAEKIYDTFGEDTIDIVMNETDRLLEIYGIGKKTVQKVKDSLTFLKTHEPTIKYLTKIGISYRTIMQLIEEFGNDTVAIIQANPYEILDVSKELSFKQVDEIYLKAGGSPISPLRLKTGFLYLLKQQAMMEGSTGCLRSDLSRKFYSLMDISGSEDFFGDTMELLEKEKKVVLGSGLYVYYKEYLDIERSIAEKVKSLEKCYMPSKKIEEDIVKEEIGNFPYTLNKEQVKAVHDCLDTNVAVLSGPAGCIAGDTLISMSRASLGRKRPIELMYKSHNNIQYRGSHGWRKDVVTYVRSYIEEQKLIRLNEVEDIVYSGKKEVWKLILEDGKTLKATADHKVMTKEGFKPLKELCTHDYVMVDNLTRHKVKINKDKGRKRIKDKLVTVGKFHPYAIDHGKHCYRVEVHRAIAEANLNEMSLDEFCRACKSPNSMRFINPSEFHVHHKDGDHYNNDVKNLEVLPIEDHLKLHAKVAYKNFGHGVPEYSRVKCVEYVGIEDTYDICCYENHNFVANGIVVHNCGKSSLTKALYRIYNRCGFNVVLLAPTAKACRRLEECTGGTAQTIHKFLKMTKDGDSHLYEDYIKDTVLIIDEASMMDIILFNNLLKGATMSTRILLVGDNNQLPSVQAGNVLGDTIDSENVHVSLLTDIMRQQENSSIIKYCSMINNGEVFEPCENPDFLYEEFGTADELKEKFLPLYKEEVKAVGLNEVQVIAPYKKGELGMNNLNTILQQEMNAKGREALEGYKVGDKVRHTQNNSKKEVFNGETGVILNFDAGEDEMIVDYGDRIVPYNRLDVAELTLSYCSTVHASQGSEYKVVFVILDDTSVNSFLHIRRLLYTAVSRGKQKVYILTKPYLVDKCIENNSYRPRITKLKDFLQEV